MWPPEIPKPFRVFASFFIAIFNRIDAGWPLSGPGINFEDTKQGRMGIVINKPRRGGGVGGSDANPLDPINTSTTVGTVTTKKVSITYGTIAGLELDTYGPITISATRWFYAHLTADEDGTPNGLELLSESAPLVIEDEQSFVETFILLGKVTVADGVISAVEPNLTGSQGVERCGFADDYAWNNWVM